MWPNPQFSADLVTFTEEIVNGKLYFSCSDCHKKTLDLSSNVCIVSKRPLPGFHLFEVSCLWNFLILSSEGRGAGSIPPGNLLSEILK